LLIEIIRITIISIHLNFLCSEEAAIEKVYKATYKEKTVVVKKFKLPSNLSQREGVQKIDMDFRNEIEILLYLTMTFHFD
jgi:hypothetical protein